jgi:drug/metabolite transporter (DMT)-like permease
MTADYRDYLHLHFLVLIWGFTAILGLLITIPPVEIVLLRTLMAAIGLAVVLRWKKLPFRIGRRNIVLIFATGLLIAAHWILFFASARISNASVCLAGLATTSFWTSLFEPIANKRRIKAYEVMLGMLVVLGLYIIFQFEFDHALGLGMAIISAILASLFTVINGRFVHSQNHYTITYYEMIGAFCGTLLFLPLYAGTLAGQQSIDLGITGMDLFYLLILSVVCTVYAYSAAVELMKKISAFAMNLTVNLEPLYGIVLAVLLFGDKEKMQPGFYAGAAVILLSVLAHPVLNRLMRRKTLKAGSA